VLTYFEKAAPRHMEDEEHSLFPRMRGSRDPQVRGVLAALDALESDHERAAAIHDEVERLCRNWMRFGHLEAAQGEQLRARIAELTALYASHIEIEEQLVFAAAERSLDQQLLTEIGREMASRRGLEWDPAKPSL
jgi:hemerythrin-like domain-containing protein